MNEVKHSPAFLRKRKMLLMLPVLILPFITLIFWSMGGGKGDSTTSRQLINVEGLNLQLPDAHIKDDKGLTKLSYYDKAAYDSVKREELLRNDPYYKIHPILIPDSATENLRDSNEDKVYSKLAALDRELNRKNIVERDDPLLIINGKNNSLATTNEIDRLEQMMQTMQQSGNGPDPEMNQLNGMLDKIMDIQHPERISEAIKKNSLKQPEKAFPVTIHEPRNNISLLVSETEMRSKLLPVKDTCFYSIEENPDNEINSSNAIEAVIHDTRTLVNGAIVKFRLLTDVFINGILIPKGNFVFGKAMLNGERLSIDIASIRFNKSILPVSLAVYDLDGLEGIFIPGAITRDVAKESSDRVIQGIALNSLDPSVGAQAANAGIEAAKNLLTKKVKLVKVIVKAGYKVLLKASP